MCELSGAYSDMGETGGRHRGSEAVALGSAGGLGAAELERYGREGQGVGDAVGAPPLQPAMQVVAVLSFLLILLATLTLNRGM